MEIRLPHHRREDALDRATVDDTLPTDDGLTHRLAAAVLGWHDTAPDAGPGACGGASNEPPPPVRLVIAPAPPAEREHCWRLTLAPARVERLIALLERDTGVMRGDGV